MFICIQHLYILAVATSSWTGNHCHWVYKKGIKRWTRGLFSLNSPLENQETVLYWWLSSVVLTTIHGSKQTISKYPSIHPFKPGLYPTTEFYRKGLCPLHSEGCSFYLCRAFRNWQHSFSTGWSLGCLVQGLGLTAHGSLLAIHHYLLGSIFSQLSP